MRLIALVLLFLFSCQEAKTAAPDPRPLDLQGTALDPLRTYCTERGLVWQGNQCSCRQDGNKSQYFNPEDSASGCTEAEAPKFPCLATYTSFRTTAIYGGREALSSCLAFVSGYRGTSLGIALSPTATLDEMLALAGWLDEGGTTALASFPLVPPLLSANRVVLSFGSSGFDTAKLQSFLEPPFPSPEDAGIRLTEWSIPIIDLDSLKAFFAPSDAAMAPAVVWGATIFYKDCLHWCEVRSVIQQDSPLIERRATYMAGIRILDRQLIARDASSDPHRIVFYGVGGTAFLTIDTQTVADGSALDQNLELISPSGDKVAFQVPLVTAAMAEARLELSPPETTPGVIVCESGLDTSSPEILSRYLRGPGKGYGGWQAPQVNRLGSLLSGLVDMDDLGILPKTSDNDHAKEVHEILSPDGAIKIIPMGTKNCLSGSQDWSGPITGQKAAQVINLSATWNLTPQQCQADVSLKEDFLWVVSAGNSGKNMDTVLSPDKSRCPQSLPASPQRLVVAGGTLATGLWPASDYGLTYADLAADVASNTESVGTSFAAPRVSRAAWRVMERLRPLLASDPKALNRLTAKILLFSVAIPGQSCQDFRPIAVRSGGFLDENKALELAEAVIHMNPADRSQLIAGRASSFENLLADFFIETQRCRIRLWHQRGLL